MRINMERGDKEISRVLIEWYEKNKRDLPWRNSVDPYTIWISEIILQQTRVAQGYDYYLRFVERFPNVRVLSEATEEEVLKYWQGLGYYSRARNLHAAAKDVVQRFDGVFPNNYKDVLSLKGIGQYTAAAILSFAWNQPYPVVDGNVFRVLSRLYGIDIPIDTSKGKKTITELAELLIDADRAALFNQAIMEFGALQCTPAKPECAICPLADSCYALAEGRPTAYPVKQNKVKVSYRFLNYFHITHNGRLFLRKRQADDIWKGLFELPMIETPVATDLVDLQKTDAFKSLFLDCGEWTLRDYRLNIKHILSHQILTASFYQVEIADPAALSEQYLLVTTDDLEHYALPRLIHQYLFPDNP